MNGDLVVLSPHLDDAVLAVGAHLARTARSGRGVQVCTAFTRGPDPATIPPRLRRFGDYATRTAEDDRALALLGARPRRLDLLERLWRQPPLPGLGAVFRTPTDRGALAMLPALVRIVREVLAEPGTELLAPLGVGNHVDHVELTVAVALAVAETGDWSRVTFYEDYYALGEAMRRRHPVTRTRRESWRASPGWAAPLQGAVLRGTALIARGPGPADYLPGLWPRAEDWCCRPTPVDGFEDLKLDAVAAYRSQTAALGGMPRLGRILRRAHRQRGGELLWRVVPR